MSLKSPAMITNRVKIPSSWFVLCIVLITQHTISYQHLNFKYLTVKLQTEHKHNLICIYNYKPNINENWFVFGDAIYARYNLFVLYQCLLAVEVGGGRPTDQSMTAD